MAALFPEIAAEFAENLTRPDMRPDSLRVRAKQRCVWRCGQCGHKFEATVANRTLGRGCPKCANLRRAESSRQPTVTSGTAAERANFPLDEFVRNLTNPGRSLDHLRPNSTDRCDWRCSVCAHRWEAIIVNRVTQRSGCPTCAQLRGAEARSTAPPDRSLSALYPELAAELVEN